MARVNPVEEKIFTENFSLPMKWLEVMAHPSVKDKAKLLMDLKYEMTIDDVLDLEEYQQYENWMNYEQYQRDSVRK